MSSETRELSIEAGAPIAYFVFMRGDVAWRYTSADRDRVFDGDTYTSAAIARGKIEQGSERRRVALSVTLPSDLPVASNWRPYPSGDAIALTVFTVHDGETTSLIDWVGRVVSPRFDGAKLTLSCEPSSTRNRRPGLQRCWQRGCPLALYHCGVNQADHELPGEIADIDGLTITADVFGDFPEGRLAGGFFKWTRASDGLLERRSISSHTGDTVVIDYGAEDLAIGLDIIVLPGCRHDPEDCDTYFNNGPNYGGQKDFPQKNPFDGDLPQ
jgi:hypothetical protein